MVKLWVENTSRERPFSCLHFYALLGPRRFRKAILGLNRLRWEWMKQGRQTGRYSPPLSILELLRVYGLVWLVRLLESLVRSRGCRHGRDGRHGWDLALPRRRPRWQGGGGKMDVNWCSRALSVCRRPPKEQQITFISTHLPFHLGRRLRSAKSHPCRPSRPCRQPRERTGDSKSLTSQTKP